LLLVAILTVAASLRLNGFLRPGIAVDEDLTLVAVEGVRQYGYPILPSRISYERGLLYTYLTSACTLVAGNPVSSGRAISVIAGLGLVAAVFLLARYAADEVAGLVAAGFVGLSPPLIVVSQWARFYSLHIILQVLAVWWYLAHRESARGIFLGLVVAACLTHELGAALIVLPAITYLAERTDVRRTWRDLAAVALTIGALWLGLSMAHRLMSVPASMLDQVSSAYLPIRRAIPMAVSDRVPWLGSLLSIAVLSALRWKPGTAVPRPFLAVVGIAASWFQLGALALATLIGVIVRPEQTGRLLVTAAIAAVLSTATWSVAFVATTAAHLDTSLLGSLVAYGISYPLDGLIHLANHDPLSLGLLVIGTVWYIRNAVKQPGSRRTGGVLVVAAWLWWAILGTLNIGMEPRHYAIPMVFTGLVCAVAAASALRSASLSLPMMNVVATLLGLTIALSQWRPTFANAGSIIDDAQRLPMTRRIYSSADFCHELVDPALRSSKLICNDELGCLDVWGRVDYWLALESFNRSAFGVVVDSEPVGRYGGGHVLDSLEALERVVSRSPALLVLQATGRVAVPPLQSLRSALQEADVSVVCAGDSFTVVATRPPTPSNR
jgi:hypothetical protein